MKPCYNNKAYKYLLPGLLPETTAEELSHLNSMPEGVALTT
jgi:hypothetical protein